MQLGSIGLESIRSVVVFFEVDVVVVVIVVVVVFEIRRTVKAHPERTTQLSR